MFQKKDSATSGGKYHKHAEETMNRVSFGVLLCLSALILLHNNHAFIGVPVFVAGIILMNRWTRRKK